MTKLQDKIALKDFSPVGYNPREIAPEAFEGLKASIREFTSTVQGWDAANGLRMVGTITVNVNGKRIIGGHQRIRALRELGQDWIHRDDVTWVEIEPDSPKEKALCVTLNNQEIAGQFTADLDFLLSDIRVEMPAFDDLGLGLLEADLAGGLEDGIRNSPDRANKADDPKELADVWFTLGEYRFEVERGQYLQWQEALRQSAGFAAADCVKELRRRLGL
ncbi:ParB N-terminal domain-containing protein [Candidatus Sumerlaeota bacterium]|nr:ParB N-terminal domain-containing protein [Candidatus Sumerlaeota bacterium]